jgi:hypothetical protein
MVYGVYIREFDRFIVVEYRIQNTEYIINTISYQFEYIT